MVMDDLATFSVGDALDQLFSLEVSNQMIVISAHVWYNG